MEPTIDDAPKMTPYQRRCAADPTYRERMSEYNRERYRREKDADPDAWNAKRSAYWINRYRTNAEFRARNLACIKVCRARKRALKEVDSASIVAT